MPACSPQRYLANNTNLIRAATLTPSSVLPVADSVNPLPVSRGGTGQVLLTGSYSGAEAATFDVQVIDNNITVPIVSIPVATGAGSGALSNIVSTGTAQTYTIQLQNAGIPTLTAGVDFEGVRIVARAIGAAGNGIEIEIDQSTLTFTPQPFSLLADLNAGDGGETTGLKGPAFDWQTKVLSADDIIPANANRVSFGDDTGDVYLQYKQYVDGEWFYHFVPAIKRHIPKGTQVSFVTGGRAVTVTPLIGAPETFTGIVTVYDLLNALFTSSLLVTVEGVIAYDRSPKGQAAKELLLRTDAHCEPSTGSGSEAATGFVDTFANANAATELVVATCTGVSSIDHPLARVGAERWNLTGSVSGALGTIVTGKPFTDPGGKFGLTVPQKLPDNYGVERGRFTHIDTIYMPRDVTLQPPICPVALTLGTEAVDQTITLTWTKRPSGNCLCSAMSVPRLSRFCLGLISPEGGDAVYQSDTLARLTALYDWYADEVLTRTNYQAQTGYFDASEDPAIGQPIGNVQPPPYSASNLESLRDLVFQYESVIAELDPITDTSCRAAGMTAWDAAVSKLEYDIDGVGAPLYNIATERYTALLNVALISGCISPAGKVDASSIISGDGCWRDLGGDFWTVVGSGKGAYAPAFNNAPYYSSRLAADGQRYFSTKEFGFQINVKCEDLLVYGDRIVLAIGDAAWGGTYQRGDQLTLPILAEQPIVLAGGQYGNEILDWYVSGSVDGALPNFQYDPSMSPPGDYAQGGLSFTFTPGGIAQEAGDKFVFTVEGGHWRYRKDGAAWIVPVPNDINTAVLAFVDGLSIQWQTGAAPSFAIGDTFSFQVAQPWAVSNVQTPNRYPWKWSGTSPTNVADAGIVQPVSAVSIARHTLPAGATLILEGGTVAGVYTWSEALIWSAGEIFKEFAVQQARYLRISLGNATGGGIGFWWAGVPLQTELSAEFEPVYAYKIESGSGGLDDSGNYLGRAVSGSLKWTEQALNETDVAGILGLLNWTKTHSDEPFVFVPNVTRPDEAFAVKIASDNVLFAEPSKYNRDIAFERRYSIDVPLAGVWRQ